MKVADLKLEEVAREICRKSGECPDEAYSSCGLVPCIKERKVRVLLDAMETLEELGYIRLLEPDPSS